MPSLHAAVAAAAGSVDELLLLTDKPVKPVALVEAFGAHSARARAQKL